MSAAEHGRELSPGDAAEAVALAFTQASDRLYGDGIVAAMIASLSRPSQFGVSGGLVMARAIGRLEVAAGDYGWRAGWNAKLGISSIAVEYARLAWSCALDARGWREL